MFWHCSYGYAGALNDINIMNMSHLQQGFLDGTFEEVERDSHEVPFSIGDEVFNKTYLLVDGIYPRYSRFVKSVVEPITAKEKAFTQFQESARKDIERAFGVLQCKFKCVVHPIYLMNTTLISEMVTAALILHNMCVSDRVMDGDVHARYNPANSFESPSGPETIRHPGDGSRSDYNGANEEAVEVREAYSRQGRWKAY